MKIVEVRTEEQFAALHDEWNALVADSATGSTFLTWEWLAAWWKAYGTPGDLNILLARDDDSVLRGIAPLRWNAVRRYGLSYKALAFAGDGSNDSDYLDFIVSHGLETPVYEAFWKHLAAERASGTLLTLNEVPRASLSAAFLLEAAKREGMIATTSDVACSVVALPATWEEYLKKLASRFRTKVRSVLRNLEGMSEVRMRFCEDATELETLHAALFELHRRRWAKDGKPGVFGWDRKQMFYRELSPMLLARRSLAFSVLEWRGRILACQYGFIYKDRYFQLQEGYDPNCEHLNPGVGLRAWTIQQFLKRGIREYDFMAGTGRHKSDWGSEVIHSKKITLAKNTPANVLYCRGPEWELGARESIKKLLPERLIAARAAAMESKNGGSFPRETLANCYYYSPLRWASPPLRHRFRLRVSRNGGFPKVRVERRREPSVRILYFHRVNNEADPFFPSSSVEQFEREIRYVAQNHCVVSLGEACRRLAEDGPSEPVVALTFDDGYEDNCSVAFPILEKYGLSATIFLTTGALDSQKPLWFERLSLAIKKAPREFVDLELEVPRRFYFRSQAERLWANDQIYGFLRYLPDDERRERLAEILVTLDFQDTGERNGKMLAWDQVRLLKSKGIDFGGHTVNHPFLSRLTPEDAAWEVLECKRRIESEIQEPIGYFAYPSGREMDFSEASKQAVRNAGYKAAVSTLWGVNHPATDRMELRRGQPWEDKKSLFAAKFDWYQWVDG
jgi:peptidoglycan/xylan/chitin deacetylase (PgdA/CDA1 family)/CelD/BcsL family acetyltransferase involved in cellulose biosynthesis